MAWSFLKSFFRSPPLTTTFAASLAQLSEHHSAAMTAAPAQDRPLALDARAVDDLVARVDAILPPLAPRVIGFVASSSGEGTSTLAQAYARANAGKLARNTLLLSTLPTATHGHGNHPSLCDALRGGQPIESVLGPRQRGVTHAALGLGLDHGDQPDYAWDLVTRRELWDFLRQRFDLIVLDLPAADVSGACMQIGPQCDGVLVVLASASTRKPVVTQLLQDLQAVQVRVLGAVLNKRSFHLPDKLYRWL
jgi:Mrp family chromosome partitioning ATPase